MGCCCSNASKNTSPIFYYNPTGLPITYFAVKTKVNVRKSRKKDLAFLTSVSEKILPESECYIISTTWMNKWKKFLSGDSLRPETIDNSSLIVKGFKVRMKRNLTLKTDYRLINKEVWEYLYQTYGGNAVIVFLVPLFYSNPKQKTSWLKGFCIHENVQVVCIAYFHSFKFFVLKLFKII